MTTSHAQGRRRPATRRLEQSERSQEEIVSAAMRAIGTVGFRDASIDMIAEAAHLSATSIYWHFGNREGLLAAVAKRITRMYSEAVAQAVVGIREPEPFIRAYVAAMVATVLRHPEMIRAQTSLSSEGALVPALRDGVRMHNRSARRPIIDTVNAGVASGAFRPVDAGAWLDHLIGSLMGASIQSRLHREGFEPGPLFEIVRGSALLQLGLDPGSNCHGDQLT